MRKAAEQQGEKPKKKGKKKWIVIAVAAVIVIAAIAGGGKDDGQQAEAPVSSEDTAQTSGTVSEAPAESEPEAPAEDEVAAYTLEHGELVSAIENEIDGRRVLVIKAKISSSYNNKATVDQNYYNVEDLVKNQGCADFDEIQYWAVADMSDGSEQKVVAFTVGAELIQKIADGSVVANKLGEQVADLFVHPSLSK